jgi:hypothetical protein
VSVPSDEYVTKQVVIKLCQGCIDKNIGSVAASFQPKTVEGAFEGIKWLQHSNQTIFGGTVRTKAPSIETAIFSSCSRHSPT